jgi:hypothetical protein
MWLGIFIAAACELATLELLVWNFAYCISVGRFLSIVWMIGVAATLPKHLVGDQGSVEAHPAAKENWSTSWQQRLLR